MTPTSTGTMVNPNPKLSTSPLVIPLTSHSSEAFSLYFTFTPTPASVEDKQYVSVQGVLTLTCDDEMSHVTLSG